MIYDRARRDRSLAGRCLAAMFRGDDDPRADAGGRLLADFLATVRRFDEAYLKQPNGK